MPHIDPVKRYRCTARIGFRLRNKDDLPAIYTFRFREAGDLGKHSDSLVGFEYVEQSENENAFAVGADYKLAFVPLPLKESPGGLCDYGGKG